MTWYLLALGAGFLSLAYGYWQITSIMKSPAGNPRMIEIAQAIQEGANAYLSRQYRTIGIVGVGVAIVLFALLGWKAALGFVVVFAIFGEYALVLVFGPEYAASYWPCLVLAFGSVLGASCTMVSIALQMTRNGGIVAKAAIVAAVCNVVLNLLLVPSFGALGAAIGTAVSLSVMQLQLAYQAQRILGVRADIFQMPSAK